MREHKDYKNILIDKILELNTAVNNKDTRAGLLEHGDVIKVPAGTKYIREAK